MFLPFDQLPDYARVWVYQSVTPFSEATSTQLLQRLQHFAQSWESHGRPLNASVQVLHSHFVIVAVDESLHAASGCSIDKSIHALQQVESELGLSLFDRSHLAYLKGGEVAFAEVKSLKKEVEAGNLGSDTIVFNNTVQTVGELRTNWQVPAGQSWTARYFRKQVVN